MLDSNRQHKSTLCYECLMSTGDISCTRSLFLPTGGHRIMLVATKWLEDRLAQDV